MLAWALLSVVACKKPPEAAPAEAPALSEPVTVRIAAINDFHGGLYEAQLRGEKGVAFGGLPWLVAAVNALRAEDPDLVVLDGGDEFQGSWPVNASQGMGAIQALQLLEIDAAAVGNHEFDYGGGENHRAAFEAAAKQAGWFLSANVAYADGTPWRPDGVKPWTVIERKGARIGVVGLTTTDTPTTTRTVNVADLVFRDPVETVKALLPELEGADLDATVLVAHLTGSCKASAYTKNADACIPEGEIGRLLTELPPGTFDAMILGHAHTVLHHRVGDTFLLENRASGHLLGQLDLVIGPDGVDADASVVHDPWALVHAPADPGCEPRPFPTDPIDVGGRTLAPDAGAVALIDALEAEAGSLCDEIACASRALGRDRARETELGSWMADALLGAFPGSDLAIQNSGGIRADLPEGTVRRETIQRIMPFDNRTLLVEISGEKLLELFRLGTNGEHGLLQVAGATYRFDYEAHELCEVTVGGQPVDPARTYRIVTSDFLFDGGDGLGPAFAGAKVVDEGPLLRDVYTLAADATEGCIGDRPLVDAAKPRISVGKCR
jgi:5'-nucleotidase